MSFHAFDLLFLNFEVCASNVVPVVCVWCDFELLFSSFFLLIFSKLFHIFKTGKPLLSLCVVCISCLASSDYVFDVLWAFFKKTCAHFGDILGIVHSFYYSTLVCHILFMFLPLDYRATIAPPIVFQNIFTKSQKIMGGP